MRRHELVRLLIVSMLILFLAVPFVASQTTLTINEPRNNELLLGRNSDFYEPMEYQVSLVSGQWNLLITSLTDLEVEVHIATDSGMTNVIAETGSEYAEQLVVPFIVSSEGMVYILVEESSNYGDSGGVYNIGVYDDDHLASALQDAPTEVDQPELSLYPFMIIGGILLFSFVICGLIGRRAKTGAETLQHQIVKAPHAAIPRRYQGRVEGDDGLRAVRVPVECPNCDAPLSSETIDWVGPLEAKCSYCGATVRAKFERI